MKKLIFAVIAVSFLALPAAAGAEEAKAPAAAADSAAAPQKQPRKEMSFEERKARAIEKTQKRLSCLQAAQTPEALRACGGKRWHHRKGGDSRRQREEPPQKQDAE